MARARLFGPVFSIRPSLPRRLLATSVFLRYGHLVRHEPAQMSVASHHDAVEPALVSHNCYVHRVRGDGHDIVASVPAYDLALRLPPLGVTISIDWNEDYSTRTH